ncbi:MAG: response regulator transcription factor [Pedobacter sp.]|nr:MAG: response regulator transcription factor [Pedobacter sp.]
MSIRILIADDHSVVRKGIRMLLEDEADVQIVGEASDGDEAIDLLASIDTDVLLLDITMPRMSGLDALKVISLQYPSVRTLMFSMHSNPDYILKAVQHGAAGYLLKDTSLEEILRAVRTVVKGDLSNLDYIEGEEFNQLKTLMDHNEPYSGNLIKEAKVAKDQLDLKVMYQIKSYWNV